MKLRQLVLLVPLLSSLTLQARLNPGIDEISVDTRMTFHQQTEEGGCTAPISREITLTST